jgi:tetratricopeptide (TPR) repeat protein
MDASPSPSPRVLVLKWIVMLTIVLGVPTLMIWVAMPFQDLSRASYLIEQHEYARAVRTLDRAIAFNFTFEQAYLRRGWIYERINMPEKALADFAAALALNPNNWQTYNNRAWLYGASGDYDRALKDVEEALSRCHDCSYVFDTKGFIYLGRKDYAQANDQFTRAIALNPKLGAAYFHRAICDKQLGKPELAFYDQSMAAELGYLHD